MKQLSTRFSTGASSFSTTFSAVFSRLPIIAALLIICCFHAELRAQNLVLNPSFETTSSCPVGISQFNLATNWNSTNTGADSCSSPDLYAGCAPAIGGANSPNGLLGYQASRTGTHHAGIILSEGFVGCTHLNDNYREYIEGQTSAPLVAGQKYLVRFYVSLPEGVMWGSNSIGVYFSNTQYLHNACPSNQLIPVTPQLNMCGPAIMDTLRWIPIQWIYTAAGGEQYFTIGNFKNDNNTNYVSLNCNTFNPYIYYYIDDVNISIAQPNQCGITILTDSVNATCGSNNGSVSINAQGCTTPFSYAWSAPGGSGTTLSNLGAGSYTVSVTDATGCVQTASVSVNAACPTTLCRNTNGSLTVSGGTAPYTWQVWDSTGTVCQGGIVFGTLCLGGTWVTTYGWKTVSTGAATTYTPPAGTDTLRVIDNAGTTVTSWNIATLSPCNACNLVVTPGRTVNVACARNASGFAKVNHTGGTAPLTYTWSPNVSTTDSASGLAAGTYTVTVSDASGCTGTASFTITGPTTNVAGTVQTNLPAGCTTNTGKIVISTTGGTPGYSYVWSPNVSTTDSATNLAAGNYSVTVTDANGCSTVVAATVSSASAITVSAGPQTNVSCNGGSNGVAHVTVSGATAPVTYTWSPNVSTADSARNLSAGTYTVTVRDANGCTGTASFTITQPATALALTNTTMQPTCGNNNGEIVVRATGGTPAYTYSWSPNVSSIDSALNLAPNTYSITVTDSHGCTATTGATLAVSTPVTAATGPQANVSCYGGSNGVAHVTVTGGTAPLTYTWSAGGSTVDSATGLTAGTYTVTVRDAGGCSASASFTITQPAAALSATAATTATSCGSSTGQITITPAGGTSGYTYVWSPNVSTTATAINLGVGTYNVTVTDAHGCTFATSGSIASTSGFSVSQGSQTNVNCYGGTTGAAQVTASGGTTPYVYTWSPNVSTTASASSLAAGTYSVTVDDQAGCSGIVTFNISQPASALSLTATVTNATCGQSNGQIQITATGGTPGYVYAWTDFALGATRTNLPAGTYTVGVSDANGCTASSTSTVTVSPAVNATAGTTINVSCNGANDGSAHINVSGGTAPLVYAWTPAAGISGAATDSAYGLRPGVTYTAIVSDGAGCADTVTVSVTQPTPYTVSHASTNADCGVSNGTASVTVSGSNGGYTYAWNNAQTSATITGLNGGLYIVTITDSKGCTYIDSVTVNVNGGPTAPTISGGPLTFCQGDSVVLTSSATGGNTWSTGATTQSITVYAAGSYTVTETSGGCTSPASAAAVVTVNPIPATPAITASGPLTFCQGGSVTLTSSAATGNLWSNGATTTTIAVSTSGTFTVVTTQLGCQSAASAPVTTTVLPNPAPVISSTDTAVCPGTTVTLDATTAGATAYVWSSGSTQPTLSATNGTYTVTVTAGSCSGTASITIGARAVLGTLTLPDSLSPCTGDTVTLDATTANATAYQWTGISATTPIVYITADPAGAGSTLYHVDVTNLCGALSDSVIVAFQDCECRIVMANAFTPNGDGRNDSYGPIMQCQNPTSLLMRIYNRWGQLIFESTSLNAKWDGTYKGEPQPLEVYTYMLEFSGLENHVQKTVHLSGTVTLMR
ncbi:MAG: gliding motility-associated C-terminal domain-containing protein [Bacteroidetes bacterium]|nr:gliding motility-associated C-terminal domain-containing protein [Bacteroidota bacterium]